MFRLQSTLNIIVRNCRRKMIDYRDTFFVLAVCWRACWAVRSDKTLGVVEALVALAVRSWSTLGKVLAVGVSGASDIIALVVSAESRRRWPATVLVVSALLFLALITDAEAFAISAFRNLECVLSQIIFIYFLRWLRKKRVRCILACSIRSLFCRKAHQTRNGHCLCIRR